MKRFGILIDENEQLAPFTEKFDGSIFCGGCSEDIYPCKTTTEVETKSGKIALRLAIVVSNVEEMSGELTSDGKTHVVALEWLPDIDSMSKERVEWERDIAHLSGDEELDYYDLYTNGHSVNAVSESCNEDELERAKNEAARASDTFTLCVGSTLDKPWNRAGNTGWQSVERWLTCSNHF